MTSENIKKLSSPTPICCAYGVCEACNSSGTNIPLIVLHGHSFSGKSNAYTSTEAFTKIENALEKDNLYIVTGILNPQPITSDSTNNFGITTLPVVFKPTYYVDYYSGIPGFIIAESKNNNIDSYALRLKEIVDYVKEITGSDKVNIVAHSMGGLVTRKYIQAFGTDSVNVFIMIGTPNHGTDSQTTTLCKLFGEEAECNDMDSQSLFISKLNSQSTKETLPEKTYLLVGRGCEMPDGSDGDGIVSAKSSEIKGIETFYYDGTCSGLNTFHTDLLEPEKYPDVYAKVLELLKD